MNEERDVIGEVIAEDNARPIHPAVAEYAVSLLHTATSDAERVAELELLNAELWRQNEELNRELAALKAKPSGVVLPPRMVCEDGYPSDDWLETNAHNRCLDEVARLNSSTVSAGVVDVCQAESGACPGDGVGACKRCPETAGGVDERAIELTRQVHQALGLSDSYLNTRDYGNGFARFKYDDVQRAFELIRAALNAGSAVPDAWRDVQAERQRQISAEGWTPEHDETHSEYPHELSIAAACYALCASGEAPHVAFAVEHFPWPGKGHGGGGKGPSTKGGPRRMLEKAGALILAEIERRDRAAAPTAKKEG